LAATAGYISSCTNRSIISCFSFFFSIGSIIKRKQARIIWIWQSSQ